VTGGINANRDVETRIRLQDERVKEIKGAIGELKEWTKETDRYFALYEPLRTFT
jgi:hypothetical protein